MRVRPCDNSIMGRKLKSRRGRSRRVSVSQTAEMKVSSPQKKLDSQAKLMESVEKAVSMEKAESLKKLASLQRDVSLDREDSQEKEESQEKRVLFPDTRESYYQPSRADENKYHITYLMLRLMKKLTRKKHPTKLKYTAAIVHRLAEHISNDFNNQTTRTGFVFDPKRWDFSKIPRRVLRDLCNEWCSTKHILHYLALNDPLFDAIICNTVMKYLMPLTVKRNACTMCCIKLCCCSCGREPPVRSITT